MTKRDLAELEKLQVILKLANDQLRQSFRLHEELIKAHDKRIAGAYYMAQSREK